MPEGIAAAHECRAVPPSHHLAHARRDVLRIEADAPVGGAGRLRTMEDAAMVQVHLAGSQHDVDGAALVDLLRDLLTARQDVVGSEGIAMPADAAPIGSGGHS